MKWSLEQMVYTVILGKETECEEALLRMNGPSVHPPRTPKPRSREGTFTSHISTVRNMITPMGSGISSKPTARTAEFLRGCRKVQEANASSRKATEIHNRLDREYPTRKGADVDLVSHPKNDVKVTHQGKS